MIVTREQQQAVIDNYIIKHPKDTDMCLGFIDGLIAGIDLIDKIGKR